MRWHVRDSWSGHGRPILQNPGPRQKAEIGSDSFGRGHPTAAGAGRAEIDSHGGPSELRYVLQTTDDVVSSLPPGLLPNTAGCLDSGSKN